MRNLLGIVLDKWVRPVLYGRDYTGGTDQKIAVDPTTKALKVKVDGLAVNYYRSLVWYIDGTVAVGDNQGPKIKMPDLSGGWTIEDVILLVDTAPTGAALIVDIDTSTNNSSWTTIFSTKPQIAAGTYEDSGNHVFSDTTLAANEYVRFNVDQVGSTVAGADLTGILILKENA